MDKWMRSNFLPSIPLGEDGRRITGSEKHIALSRRAATEGMVLLKNDGTLPLKKGTRVAVFGIGQFNYVKGGGGSGYVYSKYTRNIYEGFKIKEQEEKVRLVEEISSYYKEQYEAQDDGSTDDRVFKEVAPPMELLEKVKNEADAAIITISRYSLEDKDRTSRPYDGDYYLNYEEEAMVKAVCENFNKVVVVLNTGSVMDVKWFKDNNKISSALLAWQAGMEGGLAIADILCGDVNPSGKLTDTFTESFDDFPSSYSFNESDDFVDYTEDIYVGYRYFETIPDADKKVCYSFGFGLSYTTFDITDISVKKSGDNIEITATVTNTGEAVGKEVVQVYSSSPQGALGKPARELRAFKKTSLIAPKESETVSMSFAISDMASYDDEGVLCESAFLLEQGIYKFYVGNSVRSAAEADYVYEVKEKFVVTKQLKRCVAPEKLSKRMLSDGTYREAKSYKTEFTYKQCNTNKCFNPDKLIMFNDVAEGKANLDEFLAQLSIYEMVELLHDQPNTGCADTFGVGNLPDYGIPNIMTADGPAGVRVIPGRITGYECTAWPVETLLACTWNPELLEEIGRAAAMEVKENNFGIWLSPALNIHRNPMCGRNFEYFSEDPLISGKMAAAIVKGTQSQNVSATLKHFACNNKETNRYKSDSRVSERAIREIYIRGFEIAVKESKPWLIMTSYNKINGHYTSEHYELIEEILRGEWGYEGAVTTDWDNHATPHKEIKAGNDVRMRSNNTDRRGIYRGITNGNLTRTQIEACVKRVLQLLLKID